MARRSEVAALEARRFEAARWFARGESQAAVARAFGVTPVAAHRWFQTWQTRGKTGLKAAGRLGRKPDQHRAKSDGGVRTHAHITADHRGGRDPAVVSIAGRLPKCAISMSGLPLVLR